MLQRFDTPESAKPSFDRDGFALAHGLFSPDEVQSFIDHFMELRSKGEYPGDFAGVDPASNDPLKRYPRMIHMHRWDDLSLHWMLDPRIHHWLKVLTGEEPLAAQTMLYFKPPGARGQALHQDNLYLRAQPGNCVAAWLALDDCDEENGCLQVVPETGSLPILCPVEADTSASFTDIASPLAPGMHPVPAIMKAGDVLFFNGSTIHGSFPNRTTDRFRRSLIGHYVTTLSEEVSAYYHPILRFDGTQAHLNQAQYGGPCGEWVEVGGRSTVRMRVATPASSTESHE